MVRENVRGREERDVFGSVQIATTSAHTGQKRAPPALLADHGGATAHRAGACYVVASRRAVGRSRISLTTAARRRRANSGGPQVHKSKSVFLIFIRHYTRTRPPRLDARKKMNCIPAMTQVKFSSRPPRPAVDENRFFFHGTQNTKHSCCVCIYYGCDYSKNYSKGSRMTIY